MTRGNDRRQGNDRRTGPRAGGRRAEDAWPDVAKRWWRDPQRNAAYQLAEADDALKWAGAFARERVTAARAVGISWADIGRHFGLSAEGARKRWGAGVGAGS